MTKEERYAHPLELVFGFLADHVFELLMRAVMLLAVAAPLTVGTLVSLVLYDKNV